MRLKRTSLFVVMCVLIGACSGESSPDDTSATGDTDGTASGDRVAIDWWAFDEGGEEADTMAQLEAAFEEAHPDIDLVVTFFPEDQFDVKLETAIAAGEAPDLAPVFGYFLMRSGDLLPLDDYIEEAGIDVSTFNPGIFSEGAEFPCVFEGQVYCLGANLGGGMMIYNKDMFDAAGIPYPKPWPAMTPQEFYDLACQLSDPENQVWGASVYDPMTSFLPMESVVSTDGRTAVGVVNSPETAEVFDGLAQAFADECIPSTSLQDQGTDFFVLKQLAMTLGDGGDIRAMEAADINYGAAMVPAVEGIEPYFWTFTYSTAILASSEQPDEAFEFLSWYASDGARLGYELEDWLPLDSAIAEEVNWAADIAGRQEMIEVLSHARAPVFIPDKWEVVGPLFDAWGLIVGGEADAQEALDEAAPLIQENLDEAWETWDSGE